MIAETATANATPRPVYTVLSVVLGMTIVALLMLGALLFITSSDAATGNDLASQGKHRDCVTTVQNARRSVYDNVDIYKAILVQAAAANALGETPSQPASYYAGINAKLNAALVEARRLQPATTLNTILAHGGIIDGVHYPSCPS